VVHAWGKVAESTRPAEVEKAVALIESAEISSDGFLFFGDVVIAEAIFAGENIAIELVNQLLPTK
jgi:hypothetical protein